MRRGIPLQMLAPPLALAVCALASGVRAQDIEYNRTGFYLGGMLVGSFPLFEDKVGKWFPSGGTVSPTVGANGRFGYRAHERLAVEGMFEYGGNFPVKLDTTPPGVDPNAALREYDVFANARAFLLTGRVQPYGLAGAGFGWRQPEGGNTTNGFSMRFGGGVDYYINEEVALSAEVAYVLPTGNIADSERISLGIGATIRFFAAD